MTNALIEPECPVEQAVVFECLDGVQLRGHLWRTASPAHSRVIVNGATGVLAKYYHRYAYFLALHGFSVLTYDYRGIGNSRPSQLKGCGYRWRDWGELDFEAAVTFMERESDAPLLVVGHSIGGFLPGLAASGTKIDRMLTVGAQYAWWGDYARQRRVQLFLKWHLAMPLLAWLCGYFPGRRLGWLEDLPANVAYEWSFRRPRFEKSHPWKERRSVLSRMEDVNASIMSVVVSDDELGTPAAVLRTLNYFSNAERCAVLVRPRDYGKAEIGHFNLFHDSHKEGFWRDTLVWLRHGRNPWPRVIQVGSYPLKSNSAGQ